MYLLYTCKYINNMKVLIMFILSNTLCIIMLFLYGFADFKRHTIIIINNSFLQNSKYSHYVSSNSYITNIFIQLYSSRKYKRLVMLIFDKAKQ